MQIYEELQARGLIAQVTDEPQIRELINNGGAKFYIGFDPTADSLHVGHFMALCLMKRLQMAGNKPVVLLGGGTGFIGDPSGRTDMRSMMNAETIKHNCECFKKQMERFIEFGGDDQWSNMLAGTDLIRRKTGEDAYAMTITLLMNSEGNKMGKTAKGAVWLDPNKTSPFEFYQYWRNIDDADVMKCLRMLTFISVEELNDIEKWDDSRINEKKELLAYELTDLVHGEEEARNAREASHALFAGIGDDGNMPTTEISESDISDEGIAILDLMVTCKLASSKTEARRLVQQGGVSVDGEKIESVEMKIAKSALVQGVKIRKGKKYIIKQI